MLGLWQQTLDNICDECTNFAIHQKKYTAARKHYQADSSTTMDEPVVISADLQKVTLLIKQ